MQEPLRVNENIDNTGAAAQQLGTPKTQQTATRPVTKNRQLQNFMIKKGLTKENGYANVSHLSTPPLAQALGVPTVKLNPNKRVPAGVPPLPEAGVQPPCAKRPKPAVKPKGN